MKEDDAKRAIGEIAKALLNGELKYIEGARRIVSLRFDARLELDSDVRAFVVIDSETDALPLGSVRAYWNDTALVKLQPEIERAETWAQQVSRSASECLLNRFGRKT